MKTEIANLLKGNALGFMSKVNETLSKKAAIEVSSYKQTVVKESLEDINSKDASVLDENGIKGWKHAASDISKSRIAANHTAKTVRLKADGTENKMHDASKTHTDAARAIEHHNTMVKLNPKSKIRHNLYVNGKLVTKMDGHHDA